MNMQLDSDKSTITVDGGDVYTFSPRSPDASAWTVTLNGTEVMHVDYFDGKTWPNGPLSHQSVGREIADFWASHLKKQGKL